MYILLLEGTLSSMELNSKFELAQGWPQSHYMVKDALTFEPLASTCQLLSEWAFTILEDETQDFLNIMQALYQLSYILSVSLTSVIVGRRKEWLSAEKKGFFVVVVV